MKGHLVHIFGMRRSGTTWVAKLFDSHPNTLYRHEPDSSMQLADWPYYPDLSRDSLSEEQYEEFIAAVASAGKPHISAKMPIFRKAYLNPIRFQLLRGSAVTSKLFRRLFGAEHDVLDVSPYLPPDGTLVWKSVEAPTRAGLFANYRDDSRVVYVIRHPCGYLNSYVRGQDAGKMPRTTDTVYDENMWRRRLRAAPAVRYGLNEDVVRSWTRKERMIWEWLIDNEKVLDDVGDSESVYIANYDELCADPIAGTKRLFAHANLQWSPQTMEFLEQGRAKRESSYFGVYKNPMVAASAWREQLPGEDIEMVDRIVSDSSAGRIFL